MWDDVFTDKYETRYTAKIENLESILEYLENAYLEISKNDDYRNCAINICFDYSTAMISIFPVHRNKIEKTLNLVFNCQILNLIKQFKAISIKWYRDDEFRNEETKNSNETVFKNLDITLKKLKLSHPIIYSYYRIDPLTYENIMEEYKVYESN